MAKLDTGLRENRAAVTAVGCVGLMIRRGQQMRRVHVVPAHVARHSCSLLWMYYIYYIQTWTSTSRVPAFFQQTINFVVLVSPLSF